MVFILGIYSCEYSYIEPVKEDLPPTTNISYSDDIQPIFDDKCINCHITGGDSPDLSEGNSYNDIIGNGLVDTLNPINSIIYYYPDSSVHSGPGYSVQEKELILDWIIEGAQDDTQLVPISVFNDILPVFEINCVGCHSPGGDFPDLTPNNAYDEIINNNLVSFTNAEESIIYYYPGSIDHDWTAYSTSDGNLVLRWIKEGAQNNK